MAGMQYSTYSSVFFFSPYIKYFCFGSVEMQIKEIIIESESDEWVLDPNWR